MEGIEAIRTALTQHPAAARQFHTEWYRSGHNGADSKSVCGQPHVGSNPTHSAINLAEGNFCEVFFARWLIDTFFSVAGLGRSGRNCYTKDTARRICAGRMENDEREICGSDSGKSGRGAPRLHHRHKKPHPRVEAKRQLLAERAMAFRRKIRVNRLSEAPPGRRTVLYPGPWPAAPPAVGRAPPAR